MTAIPAVPSEPPLTDEALAEIEARAASATPGPWFGDGTWVRDSHQELVAPVHVNEIRRWDTSEADATFIAASRDDVPRLVASLRSAREEITALRGWINDTDAALEAALGDRWSPDRPPAKGVEQLAEELKRVTDRADLLHAALADAALSDAELAAIEARAEATVPGPWVHEEANGDHRVGPEDRSTWVAYTGNDNDGDGPEAAMDAEFIAAARTDVPRLVASLRSAREELMSARAERVELIAERDQARPDREAAKARLHPALHELDVRITDLPGDCHCNLVAEVILDALYGREGQTEEGASRGE